MHGLARALAAIVAVPLCACTTVGRSVFRTADVASPPYEGHVSVSFTREPPDAQAIAVVQVYGESSIERLVPELTRGAAELGGDYLKVDRVVTRFDVVEESRTVPYECGTEEEPQTCTQTQTQTNEIVTTQVIGRVFRSAR